MWIYIKEGRVGRVGGQGLGGAGGDGGRVGCYRWKEEGERHTYLSLSLYIYCHCNVCFHVSSGYEGILSGF